VDVWCAGDAMCGSTKREEVALSNHFLDANFLVLLIFTQEATEINVTCFQKYFQRKLHSKKKFMV
jgi:hypothetical protein